MNPKKTESKYKNVTKLTLVYQNLSWVATSHTATGEIPTFCETKRLITVLHLQGLTTGPCPMSDTSSLHSHVPFL